MLPRYRFLCIFWKLEYCWDTPGDANVSKDFHQGFLLCATKASLLSWCVWMADSQSSWGRYWFAEDKKDKSISEWDCGEGMNTPREAGENVNTTQQAPVLPKGKKKKKNLYLKTSRLKTKTKNFLMAKTALNIEWYFGTKPPLKVFFVWGRIGQECQTLKYKLQKQTEHCLLSLC